MVDGEGSGTMAVLLTGGGVIPSTLPPIGTPLNDMTWEEISLISASGKADDYFNVGDQKTVTIGGTDYSVMIIGKNHDTYSDGSGVAPLTFQLNGVLSSKYPMDKYEDETDGWASCLMRTNHLPSILSMMPQELQDVIREVDKLTSMDAISSPIVTVDKLFFLSVFEMFGTNQSTSNSGNTIVIDGEGTQYEWYANGNRFTTHFWLRSLNVLNKEQFHHVYTYDGKIFAGSGFPNDERFVSFAFCI